FAERESAIELEIVNRDKIAVLIGDTTDALFKLLAIFGRPPVVQVALRIVLASLVVKTVGQLVSDHQPNSAEVHGIVHVLVKERRLQNAGGKDDFVVGATVVGVDRRRRHAPFLAVERFTDLGDFALGFEFVGPQKISQQVSAYDGQRTVVAPHLGIANLVADGLQLELGLFFGFGRHPRQALDILVQRLLQRIYHFQHAPFAVGAERELYVFL